jgi:hypothetical protein
MRKICVIHKLITRYLLISIQLNNDTVQTNLRIKAGIYAVGSTGSHMATLCITEFGVQNRVKHGDKMRPFYRLVPNSGDNGLQKL